MQLLVKQENNQFTIYNQNQPYAKIKFADIKNSDIDFDGNFFKIEEGKDKNMILKHNDKVIFKFKFDYLSGGAEIISDEIYANYEIKGRWFKPGTRLINDTDDDLVVVKNFDNDIEVLIIDENISKLMVVCTVYYHIYASSNKFLSVLSSTIIGGVL